MYLCVCVCVFCILFFKDQLNPYLYTNVTASHGQKLRLIQLSHLKGQWTIF